MEHALDVSGLEPPEPMERILEALGTLEKGDYLRIMHRREPYLIYPMFENMGFAWHTRPGGPAGYEIFVWRQNDEAACAEIPPSRWSQPRKQK